MDYEAYRQEHSQSRLETLRNKRRYWAARRAARKYLFSRPTPRATHLLSLAYVHKTLGYIQLAVSLLLLLRLGVRASGLAVSHVAYLVLEAMTDSVLGGLPRWLPNISLGRRGQLELAIPVAIALWMIIFRLLNWLVHVIGTVRTPRTDRSDRNG